MGRKEQCHLRKMENQSYLLEIATKILQAVNTRTHTNTIWFNKYAYVSGSTTFVSIIDLQKMITLAFNYKINLL